MHAAEGCVDADASHLCYLLEAEVFVETHDDDFTLWLGQVVEQVTDALSRLAVNHLVFACGFAEPHAVENFGCHLVFANSLCGLNLAALVENEIVSDACEPCAELAICLVFVAAYGYDGSLERVLEEVVGHIRVFYQKEYIGIDVRLMSGEQNIKCLPIRKYLLQCLQ